MVVGWRRTRPRARPGQRAGNGGRPIYSRCAMASTSTSPRDTRLAEQRRSLPDGPGVYLFHDAAGTVIYVGKAKSIRKRVAGHFSNAKGTGATRGAVEMVSRIHRI